MSNRLRKRTEKRKRREKALKTKSCEREERRRLWKRRQQYPDFVFLPNDDAPAGFVDLIRTAVESIDFEDTKQFPRWEQSLYKEIRSRGWSYIRRDFLYLTKQENDKSVRADAIRFVFNLGNQVLARIPQQKLLSYIPHSCVDIEPKGNHIGVRFRTLKTERGAWGTIYYSAHRPTVVIGGEEKIVAFSDHAIRQICDRTVYDWVTYSGLGDAFGFLDNCRRFDRVDLTNGQMALTFFDSCRPGFVHYRVAEEVLDIEEEADGYHYRVGYCPVVVEGEFVKAKTLLIPGYRSTPEYDLIHTARLSRQEREELRKKAEDQLKSCVTSGSDLSMVKWFHQQGVPQVIHTKERLFDYR